MDNYKSLGYNNQLLKDSSNAESLESIYNNETNELESVESVGSSSSSNDLTDDSLSTVPVDKLISGVFEASEFIIGNSGRIRSGQTAWDTGDGWWIGDVDGTKKLSIGSSTGDKVTWDGSALTIVGSLSAGSISIGTSPNWFRVDTSGNTWWGANLFADAPASITPAGVALFQSGIIGGWNITSTLLRSGTTDANSNIILNPTTGLIRSGVSTGNYITIDGANLRIRSSNYVSGVFGTGFTLEPNLLEIGNIAARGIIRTAVFQKDVVSAVGGNLAVLDSDVLDIDMTALDSMTLTIKGTTSFSVGDILRIKDGIDDEWMEITDISSAPLYVVTRDKADSYTADHNPVWKKGASVVNYGQSGDGGVYMTASETNAPYLSIFDHVGSPWTTITTRVRLGNLTGLNNPMTGGALTGYGLWTDNVYLTGVIVANSGKIGSVDNYWSIGSTGLTAISASTDVIINYGKTDFGQDSTNGFILGYDYSASKPKFEIGSSATKILTYDGTDFSLKGGTIIGGIFKTQETGTPDVQIDTTDGITVYGESVWFAVDAAAAVKFSSYSESNYTSPSSMYAGSIISRGQTFLPSRTGQLGSCKLYLKKVGSPTGNFTAKIYAMSGTYGTSGIPTGSPLATSDNYDISTLSTSIELITLTFSGANQINLFPSNYYVLVVSYNDGDSSNYLDVGKDNSSPTYGGTSVYTSDDSSWSYTTGVNLIFYVYTTAFGTTAGKIRASTTSGLQISNDDKTGATSNYPINIDANNSDIDISGGNVYMESYSATLDIKKEIEMVPENYVYINGTLKLRPLLSTTPVAEEGNIYFNTTDKHFYGHNGTSWIQLDN